MEFETLDVHRDGAVLFAEIAAPPMNLLGPELVRDLVSLPEHEPPRDYRADRRTRARGGGRVRACVRHAVECGRDPESQRRTQVAMTRGFQTPDGEISLTNLLGQGRA